MKLATYTTNGRTRTGIVVGDRIVDTGVQGTMIDLIREVGAHPTMNIMVSGGVFNRAEDLWKEINADLYAGTAKEALDIADNAAPRTPDMRVPGAPKKRRRRRRPPLLIEMEERRKAAQPS